MVRYQFEECLARPDSPDGQRFLLKDHLLQVAFMASGFALPKNNAERLRFLAYLLHDSGKAAETWQDYIRNKGKTSIHHAQLSSFIFSHIGDLFLNSFESDKEEKFQLERLYLKLTSFIFAHHGEFPNYFSENPPWLGAFPCSHLLEIDFPGLASFLNPFFPELTVLSTLSEKEWEEKMLSLKRHWEKMAQRAIFQIKNESYRGNRFLLASRNCVQTVEEASALIRADRINAAGFDQLLPEMLIAKDEALNSLRAIDRYCEEKKKSGHTAQEILQAREESRNLAVATYNAHRDATFFSLELPTGYGKTLTALSAALNSVALGVKSRIIYVAPYLSIISQSADQIRAATGMDVFEDHSLAYLSREEEYISPSDEVLRESWKSPIIATTYNQLFRILFPGRMQDTMRVDGLRNSFIIVDEPQSVGSNSWNPFLNVLESAASSMNFQVLFSTATLPETSYGILESDLICLGKRPPALERFKIEQLPSLSEEQLVEEVKREISHFSKIAVILNTINDATIVAQLLKKQIQGEGIKIYYLSGRLIPVHKSCRIQEIYQGLKEEGKVIVISTQAIECGVDLSFDVIYRALPVFPSILQAAGRCNRHGEKKCGLVKVFPFLREGKKDTRLYVYQDSVQRSSTEKILRQGKEKFGESESYTLMEAYFKLLFAQNTYQQPLEFLERGALGDWEKLSSLEPFSEPELNKVSLFVPFQGELPKMILDELQRYGCRDSQELWQKYIDRSFRHSLNFRQKMRFFSLLNRFALEVRVEEAQEYGKEFEGSKMLYLAYPSRYSSEYGLLPADNQTLYQEQII
ncbi:MAG: CRISPR-associated helicase Cas3' [bacterium]